MLSAPVTRPCATSGTLSASVTARAALEHRRQLVLGFVPLEDDQARARHQLLDRVGERAEQILRCLLGEQPGEDVGDPLVGAKLDIVLFPTRCASSIWPQSRARLL